MAVTKPRFDFPRSVSYEAEAHENLAPILRRDIGVFWDLRRSHLGLETINSVESMVLALRYRTSLLREFCTEWLGLGGLNVLVKIAVVCDLPSGAALEVQRQHIIRAFDDLQMQFCNVEGSLHVPMARREGMSRFVTQFINEYPNPLLVVVSDDLRILQSVRHISGDAIIIPIISRSKHDRRSDGQNRRFFNRILADNIALHPWDVYFYETIMLVTLKGWRYPKNCLDLLYSSKHDNVTAKEPLLAWLVSLLLQTFTVVPRSNLADHQRLSKIATLKSAIQYIQTMVHILQASGGFIRPLVDRTPGPVKKGRKKKSNRKERKKPKRLRPTTQLLRCQPDAKSKAGTT